MKDIDEKRNQVMEGEVGAFSLGGLIGKTNVHLQKSEEARATLTKCEGL